MKKKLIMVVPLLLVAGIGYKMFLAPKPVPVKHKIEGTIQALQRDFLVNLADGQYAKVAVAVVLEEMSTAAAAEGEATAGLPQEPVVRAIILDELTGIPSEQLVSRHGRERLGKRIVKLIKKRTDEHIGDVIFTDITVQ